MTFEGETEVEPLAETGATTRELQAVALINDPARRQVIASVITTDGYALVGLDPATLETRWTVSAPDYVSRFSLADDGATLYALMPDAKAVWQFDLRTNGSVRVIPTTDGSSPLDVAVRPGHPETIVVTSGRPELPSPFGRAQAFDKGVPRPQWIGVADGTAAYSSPVNEVEFINADTLLALDTQTSSCAKQHVSLAASGLLGTDVNREQGGCFGDQLSSHSGRLFTQGGEEMDTMRLTRLTSFPGGKAFGGPSPLGFGIFHPGLNSYVRVYHDDSLTAKFHRVRIDEYSMDTRQYMKRRFVAVAPTPLTTTGVGARSVIQDAVAVGTSRMVVAVYDQNASGRPQVMLISIDVAAVDLLQPWNFSTRKASTGSINGWALRIPTEQVTYDAAIDRIIATVSLVAGPSGASIAVIRPDTGAVERLIPLLAKPRAMSVSAQGSIAYVSSSLTKTLQKIDLKSGTILATMNDFNAIDIIVKPDDPHTFAAITLSGAMDFQLSSFTNMVELPLLIDRRSQMSLQHATLLGVDSTGSAHQLLVYHRTSPNSVWRLNWTSSGLSISEPGQSAGIGMGGSGPRMDFGRISSFSAVIESATGVTRGLFNSTTYREIQLSAANAGVALMHDHANYSPALQWITEPAVPNAALSWDKGQYLVVKDNAEKDTSTYLTLEWLVRSPPGRAALRKTATEGYMGSDLHFGYLYVVKKD